MSTSFIAMKRWMNLMPILILLVAVYGTAVSVEYARIVSALTVPADSTPEEGASPRRHDVLRERMKADAFTVPPSKTDSSVAALPQPPAKTQAAVRTFPAVPASPAPPPVSAKPLPMKPKPAPPADYPKVKVVATGYTAGIESTGKRPGDRGYGITFSGVKVRRDHVSTVAADPRVFPIGTLLYIPGYGYGVVADTGSKIKGRKIDLYFETKRDVFRDWGKKTVHVQVLRMGEGKLKESWLRKLNSVVAAEKTLPASYFEA